MYGVHEAVSNRYDVFVDLLASISPPHYGHEVRLDGGRKRRVMYRNCNSLAAPQMMALFGVDAGNVRRYMKIIFSTLDLSQFYIKERSPNFSL